MQGLIGVLDFIATQIFRQPALMLFVVAFVGLMLQRKTVEHVFVGSLKTAIGFLILWAGAGVLVQAIMPLTPILRYAFAPEISLPAEGSWADFLSEYGSAVAFTMTFAFLLNLLLARFTRFKYIFLTGHIIFQISGVAVALGLTAAGLSGVGLIVFASVLTGLIMTFGPAVTQPYTRKITGGDSFALGHAINFMTVVGAWIGSKVGNPAKSTEDIKFPKRLGFLADSTIAAAIILVVLYVSAVLYVGRGYVSTSFSGDQNYVVWAFMQAIQGAVGLAIIFQGARMMLAELVPAFRGIALKVVPNAIPALDMPVLFGYAPTALMLGFVSATVGSTVGMFILGRFWPAYIFFPAMIPCFFDGGTVAIYANKTGGIRGALIASFLTGVVVVLGGALALPFLAPHMGDFLRQFTDNDYATIIPALGHLIRFVRGF